MPSMKHIKETKTLSPGCGGLVEYSLKVQKQSEKMDGVTQLALPVLGIVAAAAATFYVVSFSELREKSFRDLEDSEYEKGGFDSYVSSRKRRAIRKAEKKAKN
ncbi:hypothetical protein ERO13_A11G156100v2 [Gossypium hirsutum]|uniref:Uncharacterized protein n=7 Tax=Gossypium TaxID=3633 RepID=A0ABR0N399_GOSAR|nr:uncharacterized protein LOC107923233 [Gossypium hirsutum]XP_017629716.2 uncharacterized protein LOC108472673 [Gossypium arboreum]KAB2057416.1 hypothetical protein ES319_A11G167000v1 [Gossypium barbadense]TYG94304.1 hypothetical protein ES288_A11G177800v1 [Gossypium darwinii]TYI01096.1 hypothetical protein ES332_A11G177700v1 [Gossypium tomentosum]TYJ09888.1 hypothetical protein E1A91_A11G170000v1 [Gossypium mustelinum]KAG4175000.1 hypothetical protein ERO13_A11G156100v2 [Gossypium hirsutum]